MHVISRKILREFCEVHADACDALYDWYRVVTKSEWENLADVQRIYQKLKQLATLLYLISKETTTV
jgi:mRNA interferase HigB